MLQVYNCLSMIQPAPLFSKIDESTVAKLKGRFSGKQTTQDPQKLQEFGYSVFHYNFPLWNSNH